MTSSCKKCVAGEWYDETISKTCVTECPAGTEANNSTILCESLCSADGTHPVWNTATTACGRCAAGEVSLDSKCVAECG